jgi:hypothetical protein
MRWQLVVPYGERYSFWFLQVFAVADKLTFVYGGSSHSSARRQSIAQMLAENVANHVDVPHSARGGLGDKHFLQFIDVARRL